MNKQLFARIQTKPHPAWLQFAPFGQQTVQAERDVDIFRVKRGQNNVRHGGSLAKDTIRRNVVCNYCFLLDVIRFAKRASHKEYWGPVFR